MRKKEKEVADISEIELIIKNSDVCRIAFADGNIPYIVTMNFGYCGGKEKKIYFHCAPEGRKIDLIGRNNFVCFEMDTDHKITNGIQACDFSMKYSSVVGYGYIAVINNTEEKIIGLNQIMFHYAGKADFSFKPDILKKTTILRLDIKEITGKRC